MIRRWLHSMWHPGYVFLWDTLKNGTRVYLCGRHRCGRCFYEPPKNWLERKDK